MWSVKLDFPGQEFIQDPIYDLRYEIDIAAAPGDIWPWIVQMGYHRGGWYIDTWWDEFMQVHFWPRVVPEDARGTFKPPADRILPEYQHINVGDTIPDGPPGSAYYEVKAVELERLLLLYASSHFKYMAPQFVYKTRLAPQGAFCWAFILQEMDSSHTRLTSWWRAQGAPRFVFLLAKPFLNLVDGLHQRQILKGIQKRVENQVAS